MTILYLQGAAAGAIYVYSSRYKEHNIEPDMQSSKNAFKNTHSKVSNFSIYQYLKFLIENKVPVVEIESVIGNTSAPRHSISENI